MTAHATTEKDGSAIVTLNGQPQKVIGASLEDARRKVASIVVDHAAATGEVVEFILGAVDQFIDHRLDVGARRELLDEPGHPRQRRAARAALPAAASARPV